VYDVYVNTELEGRMAEIVTPQRSGWRRGAPEPQAYPPLAQDLAADSVIVGAGYAGLNAALRLAERGTQAVVLEAREVGFGASGRNGGQVIPGLKYDPPELISMFGAERGRLLADFAGHAATRTFQLIERYDLHCHPRRCGWLQPAVDAATVTRVSQRAQAWRDFAGVDARILDADETRAATGTDFYVGGWIDPRGGQLQPLAYARELARVATAQGAQIFARSPVTRLDRAAGGWTLQANGHTVRARAVLVCTNGYTDALLPQLRRSYVAASSILCATAPLPDALRRQIMPAGLPISDARRLMNYMSFDPEGRFMIGARGSFGLHEPESYFARLRKTAKRIFPVLRGVPWEDAWGGRFALTADHLPHLHNPAPGLYAVLGCNGRGVAMLSRLGRLVADLASGAITPAQSPVPVTPIAPIPLHALRRIGLEAVGAWYRMLDRVGV
jgi:glycine/D-amino acid oxidase-like deaminating enzyme